MKTNADIAGGASGWRGFALSREAVARVGAWVVLAVSLLTYLLTVEPTASYWDCPEYILVGSLLEVGHPPGNPTWMLFARMASLFAPDPGSVAVCINATSGIFTALAAMLLYLTAMRLLRPGGGETLINFVARSAGSISGALAFAWCDTAWFSAVEAEVYAFSIFCTALCVWLALRWSDEGFSPGGQRLLILIAYITGLSIGVHQLNLLCFPTLALIMVFRSGSRNGTFRKAVAACLLSLVAIGAVLYGLMPGSIDVAGLFELAAVNGAGLPFHTGVAVYAASTVIVVAAAALTAGRGWRFPASVLFALSLWLTGILSFCGGVAVAAGLSLCAGIITVLLWRRLKRWIPLACWCLAMLWLGYATYGVILVRGAARPPVNEGAPTDIFALKSYISREQYGSKPLLYGRTPFSSMLRREKISGTEDSPVVSYNEVWRDVGAPRYARAISGRSPLRARAALDGSDSVFNASASGMVAKGKDAYIVARHKVDYRYPPELDMWFPRITSSDPADLKAYESWSGMTAATMDSVRVSFAVDSAGNAVGRLDPRTGKRTEEWAKRPTYMQNLSYFLSYQVGYMYMRYLMWNFSGRQNDRHSTGEADDGNFITGIPFADDAMLGPQELLPPDHSSRNPGRHLFFMLPFLLGLAGLAAQIAGGRRGRRSAAVVGSLFVMTGIVIVIYVNQTPGEPRERDYSYVGSFYAFAIWIAAGGCEFIRLASRLPGKRVAALLATLLTLALPVWMCASNWKDHDRSGRRITTDMAAGVLESLDRDAIIFVNGDNYTFPLWYVREVEGVRPDVRVVNIAYLSTGWYALQMMMADRESAPLPLTAVPEDVACDDFILSFYGSDSPSHTRRDALDLLRDLYSQRGRKMPRLNADTIVFGTGDSSRPGLASVSLRSVAGGKSNISLQQLMMIDILATNAASPDPRPVYWISSTKPHHFAGLYDHTVDEGLVRRLTGRRVPADSLDSRRFYSVVSSPGFRFGNASGCYVDPTSASIVGRLRQSMIRLGGELLSRGDVDKALAVARMVEDSIPGRSLAYKVYTEDFILKSEAVELARIYGRCAAAKGSGDLRRHAFSLLKAEIERLGYWRRFYSSLPAWRRGVMSPVPRLSSSCLYAPVALWLELGGDPAELKSMPALRGLDLAKESAEWEKNVALRRILNSSRVPASDSVMEMLFSRYRDLGGHASDLAGYPAFDTCRFLWLLPE